MEIRNTHIELTCGQRLTQRAAALKSGHRFTVGAVNVPVICRKSPCALLNVFASTAVPAVRARARVCVCVWKGVGWGCSTLSESTAQRVTIISGMRARRPQIAGKVKLLV